MLTVLIAEDDPAMRLVTKKILSEIPGVEVLGEAGDGITALRLVEELCPRVVFIDIDLPEKNGIELAREICDIDPQTILIFATAYADFTHEAFEVYAYDYLVKPFKLDRIKQTIERIMKTDLDKKSVLANFHQQPMDKIIPDRLLLKQKEKLFFLDTKEIIFITRENRKTVIITTRQKFSTNENLNDIEERLTGNYFLRSHRGYIINLSLIREVYPWGKRGYQVSFTGTQETALLAWNKAKELEKIMG